MGVRGPLDTSSSMDIVDRLSMASTPYLPGTAFKNVTRRLSPVMHAASPELRADGFTCTTERPRNSGTVRKVGSPSLRDTPNKDRVARTQAGLGKSRKLNSFLSGAEEIGLGCAPPDLVGARRPLGEVHPNVKRSQESSGKALGDAGTFQAHGITGEQALATPRCEFQWPLPPSCRVSTPKATPLALSPRRGAAPRVASPHLASRLVPRTTHPGTGSTVRERTTPAPPPDSPAAPSPDLLHFSPFTLPSGVGLDGMPEGVGVPSTPVARQGLTLPMSASTTSKGSASGSSPLLTPSPVLLTPASQNDSPNFPLDYKPAYEELRERYDQVRARLAEADGKVLAARDKARTGVQAAMRTQDDLKARLAVAQDDAATRLVQTERQIASLKADRDLLAGKLAAAAKDKKELTTMRAEVKAARTETKAARAAKAEMQAERDGLAAQLATSSTGSHDAQNSLVTIASQLST
eukprot:gene5890-1051_t